MNEMIEYIWNKPRYRTIKVEDGEDIILVNTDRRRKGVMVAIYEPGSDTVAIGFSLCNSLDQFDYKDGKKEKGFGLGIAKKRGTKNIDTEWIKIHGITSIPQKLRDQGDKDDKWIPEVKIPASVVVPLRNFVDRCRRYYQDKNLPVWVHLLDDETVINSIRESISEKDLMEKGDDILNPDCMVCTDDECIGCPGFRD